MKSTGKPKIRIKQIESIESNISSSDRTFTKFKLFLNSDSISQIFISIMSYRQRDTRKKQVKKDLKKICICTHTHK